MNDAAPTAPAHTGSGGSRVLGVAALAAVAALVGIGLLASPRDTDQGDLVRLMYVHVPSAIGAYLAFGATALGSVLWLWKKSSWWDLVASASAEIGVLFTGLCLLTGSLWGSETWGTYWQWDPRLTTTALLFLIFLGYLVVRRLPADRPARNTRSAVVGLVGFANVPIVHFAVDWWRSLHQAATISTFDVKIEGLQLFSLMLGMVTFALVYAWLVLHRFRVAFLEDVVEQRWLDAAIQERRREGDGPIGGIVPGSA